MEKLSIETKENKCVVDLSEQVSEIIKKKTMKKGLCHVFLKHTTCALTTADIDPDTEQDLMDALKAMVPKIDFRHHHDPSHMGDHIIASIIGSEVTIPVEDNKLSLGTWQRIVLIEFSGPRKREVVINLVHIN